MNETNETSAAPDGYRIGPRGHWYGQCKCGRWVKVTGIGRGLHLCSEALK